MNGYRLTDTSFVASLWGSAAGQPVPQSNLCASITVKSPYVIIQGFVEHNYLDGWPSVYIAPSYTEAGADAYIIHSDIGLVYSSYDDARAAWDAGTYDESLSTTVYAKLIDTVNGDDKTDDFPWILDGYYPTEDDINDAEGIGYIPFHDNNTHTILNGGNVPNDVKLKLFGTIIKGTCADPYDFESDAFTWNHYNVCNPSMTLGNLHLDWAGDASSGYTPSVQADSVSLTECDGLHISLKSPAFSTHSSALLSGNSGEANELFITDQQLLAGYDLSQLDSGLSAVANCASSFTIEVRVTPYIDCAHGSIWGNSISQGSNQHVSDDNPCMGYQLTKCSDGGTIVIIDAGEFGNTVNTGDVIVYTDGNDNIDKCATVTSTALQDLVSQGHSVSHVGGFTSCSECEAHLSGSGGGGGSTVDGYDVTECNTGTVYFVSDSMYNWDGYVSSGSPVSFYHSASSTYYCGTINGSRYSAADSGYESDSWGYSDCADCISTLGL